MTFSSWWLLVPIFSALIGWVTNVIAIKSLFRPKEEVRILGLRFHGVFPKRKNSIAEKLGRLVATRLLSSEAIQKQLATEENALRISEFLQPHLEDFIHQAVSEEKRDITSRFIRHLLQHNKSKLAKRISSRIPEVLANITESERFTSVIQEIVSEKVRQFSSDELETLVEALIKKELKWIEVLGGILGFIIGLLQLTIMILA